MIGQFVVRDFLYRPNCQEQNYHFAALNLKVKERRLSTLKNWMLTLSFNILICVYLWRKAFKKLNHNLITEENSSQCLKILSQYTVKKTKVDWLKGKQAIPSTNTVMYDNKHSCKHTCSRSSWQASLPFAMFFSKTHERKIEATSSQTQCPVFKTRVSHWRANAYCALSFDHLSFFNMHFGNLIFLSMKSLCGVLLFP